MQLHCPHCGARDARIAHRKGVGEFFRGLFGWTPLRCKRCKARWETSVWANGAWRYASCPKCYRQDLTFWSETHYNPPSSTRFWLMLGAKHIRCEACRCNFASFRPRRERFSRKHEDRVPAVTDLANEIHPPEPHA